MSAATLISNGLRVNNSDRKIERTLVEQDDVSIFNKNDALQRITEKLESSYIAISISENTTQQIENILYSKEPLIRERNAIIDNPFKYYNPFYQKKLKIIDAKLDKLDLQLYALESETRQIESDLERAIESAQEKLRNIIKTSPKISL